MILSSKSLAGQYVQVNKQGNPPANLDCSWLTYYNVLEDDTFGYTNVTIIALLSQLQVNYATLSADDLGLNWLDAIVGSLEYWRTIGESLEQGQTLACSLLLMRVVNLSWTVPLCGCSWRHWKKNGAYSHSICTWRNKLEAERTWPTFQTHFINSKNKNPTLLQLITFKLMMILQVL